MHAFSKIAALSTALTASLAAAHAVPALQARDVSLPGLPAGCMTSYNGIAWGWLPDDYRHTTLADLKQATGKQGCFFGDYTHINDANYDDPNIVSRGLASTGAIVVPSFMPNIPWNEVDDNIAGRIGNIVQQYSDAGFTTYLRYAHEMNCYGKRGCAGDASYPGYDDYQGFKDSWIRIANVCRGIANCYMYWCPNLQDLDTLGNWFPGADYIDVIGVDHYPDSGSVYNGFSGNYKDFYDQWVTPYGKPFLLGETATASSIDDKDAWVAAVAQDDYSSFPLYKGAMWFEYNNPNDFYVVLDQSVDQVNKFLTNFA